MRPPLAILRWTALALLLLTSLGQTAAAASLSDDAEVTVVTVYPGDDLHARFGHTAVRVHDPSQDLDLLFNYGTFHFDSPAFIFTFISGRLDYYLSVSSTPANFHHYQHVERRAIVEQVLDLTLPQREAVFRYLVDNAQPENATYRYHFLYDNCSTRVRDVFADVLGSALSFEDAPDPRWTYRQMLRPYMADAALLWLGMDLALGQPADGVVTRWQTMFLPLPLRDAFDAATLTVDGEERRLVRETRNIYWDEAAAGPTGGNNWPTLVACVALIVGLLATWRQAVVWRRSSRLRRRRTLALDAGLLAVVGIAGLVLLLIWTATAHDVAGPNWNILWAWPTHIIAAAWLLKSPGSPVLRLYLQATAVALVLAAITAPAWPQAVPAAAWPIMLLLALRTGWLGWGPPFAPRQPRGPITPASPARAGES